MSKGGCYSEVGHWLPSEYQLPTLWVKVGETELDCSIHKVAGTGRVEENKLVQTGKAATAIEGLQ